MDVLSSWMDFFTFDSLSGSVLLVVIILALVIYGLFDLYRPTTPIRLSYNYTWKRTLNWMLIGMCSAVESMNTACLTILGTQDKETLYTMGVNKNTLIIMVGCAFMIKPLFMVINGMLIDRFEKVTRNGKYILIFGMFTHALINVIMGSVLALTLLPKESGSSDAAHALLSILAGGGSGEGVPAPKSGDDTNVVDTGSVAPLLYISHLISTYVNTVVELVQGKICSAWYHDKHERATISGLLNVFQSWQWFMAYVINVYVFTKYNTSGPTVMLFASSAFLCVAAVCATLISKEWSPSSDYNYYTLRLRAQQDRWERDMLLVAGIDSDSLRQYEDSELDTQEETVDQAKDNHEHPPQSDSSHKQSHDDHHHEHIHYGHHESVDQIDKHFPFEDPMQLDRLSFRQALSEPELYVFSFAFLFVGIGTESWYTNFISNLIEKFDIGFGSGVSTVALLLITCAPAISCMVCVLLINLVIRERQRFMSVSSLGSVSLFIYAGISAGAFMADSIGGLITCGFLCIIVRMCSMTTLRYQSQMLGGSSKAATATGVVFSGMYLGNGIAKFSFGLTESNSDYNQATQTRVIVQSVCCFCASVVLLGWHVFSFIKQKRKYQ
ncbi:Sec-independent protein translocase protein TatB [Acrasis kona]|uniref:Sec-independent protein translocase protein TatB n=1 Tax=Acrasis kona TaxID=1008807 RepID=A0AAW2YKH2_9EUKA